MVQNTSLKKIEELKIADYNPRKINEKNLNNLKKSLKEFGWLSPVVINSNELRKNIVISGHQRIKAAKELGQKEVPCIEVDLDEAKEKALNLAMNKIGGEFEEDKLIELLSQIDQHNEDLLSITGFDTTEINYLLGLKDEEKNAMFAKSQEDKFDVKNKYDIHEGDIIEIDGHRIICGDSSKVENFEKLIGDNQIDLCVTSPPYNLDIKYGKYQDNQNYKDYLKMIKSVFENVKNFMPKGTEGRFICVNIGREWGPMNLQADYHNLLAELDYTFFRNIYWMKPLGAARGTNTKNPFPRYYKPKVQTEIIQLYSTDDNPRFYDHMLTYTTSGSPEKKRDEQIPNILISKYSGNVWEFNTEGHLSGDHPAPFPVQLPFNCIRFFSFEGEKILDPFTGSGTTMIATDQLKRKFYGIELDPNYINVAIERYLIYKPEAKFEIIKREVQNESQTMVSDQ
jgi:DNA modification methylase